MMKMETEKLVEIIEDATKVYRKGPLIDVRKEKSFEVVEVFDYPHTGMAGQDKNHEKVDMIFVDVVVDRKKAEAYRKDIEGILKQYPEPARLAGGPSYIELAPALGVEQTTALRLMALGSSIGMWQIVDAKRLLRAEDTQARELAGNGFLMISGWKAAEPSRGKLKG
jgi:hypothetical protein